MVVHHRCSFIFTSTKNGHIVRKEQSYQIKRFAFAFWICYKYSLITSISTPCLCNYLFHVQQLVAKFLEWNINFEFISKFCPVHVFIIIYILLYYTKLLMQGNDYVIKGIFIVCLNSSWTCLVVKRCYGCYINLGVVSITLMNLMKCKCNHIFF